MAASECFKLSDLSFSILAGANFPVEARHLETLKASIGHMPERRFQIAFLKLRATLLIRFWVRTARARYMARRRARRLRWSPNLTRRLRFIRLLREAMRTFQEPERQVDWDLRLRHFSVVNLKAAFS